MDNWADLVASLRAGAQPSDLLPRLRDLLNTIPQSSEPSEPVTPLSNLYHSLNPHSDDIFQIPYLRPPAEVWYLLEDEASAEQSNRTQLFDSELNLDLLSSFRPRFISPPPLDVRKLLENENQSTCFTSNAVLPTTSMPAELDISRTPKMNIVNAISKSACCTRQELSTLTKKLSQILRSSSGDLSVSNDADTMSFPNLSEDEWALIVSASDIDYCTNNILILLQKVNQPSFARVTLRSLLPCNIASFETSVKQFLQTVDTAARIGRIHEMSTVEIREIMYSYSGSLGVASQLRISNAVSWIGKVN